MQRRNQGGVAVPGHPVADLFLLADLEQSIPAGGVVVSGPVPLEAGLLALQEPRDAGAEDAEHEECVEGLAGAEAP